jgi:elongation factor G
MDVVPYYETITSTVENDFCHKQSLGGAGEFARIKLRIEPITPGLFEFANEMTAEAVPADLTAGIENEIRKCAGTLAGFQITGVKVTVIGGAYHEIDSSARVFRIAAAKAFSEAVRQAYPKIIMAIMRVHVRTPEDFFGGTIGDLKLRNGQIQTTVENDAAEIEIEALIPAYNLEGYEKILEAMTQGRGSVSMTVDHYEDVSGYDPDPNFPGAMAMRVAG